jgi:hypothetical protein
LSKIIEIEKDLILSTVNGKTDKFFKKKKRISLNDRPSSVQEELNAQESPV